MAGSGRPRHQTVSRMRRGTGLTSTRGDKMSKETEARTCCPVCEEEFLGEYEICNGCDDNGAYRCLICREWFSGEENGCRHVFRDSCGIEAGAGADTGDPEDYIKESF